MFTFFHQRNFSNFHHELCRVAAIPKWSGKVWLISTTGKICCWILVECGKENKNVELSSHMFPHEKCSSEPDESCQLLFFSFSALCSLWSVRAREESSSSGGNLQNWMLSNLKSVTQQKRSSGAACDGKFQLFHLSALSRCVTFWSLARIANWKVSNEISRHWSATIWI